MIYTINMFLTVLTIAFGMIGWLAPRFTMKKLGLQTDGTNIGYSEIRAANGALFVGAGAGAMFLSLPAAFAIVGFMYLGAAIGRLTGILFDNAGSIRSWSYFGVEAVFAGFLIIANASAFG